MEYRAPTADPAQVFTVLSPPRQTVPLVFSSPHSGRDYSADFIASSRLDPQALRRSEDSFVDELFACAADHGAPLLAALFPRAFCDPNREPYELDPAMFAGRLPEAANTRSPRVVAGLGTIPKVVASGAEIYAGRLPVSEIERRIGSYYRPYHQRLRELVEETQRQFGWVVLVDCHSMPASSAPADGLPGGGGADVVLGDCYGASAAGDIVACIEDGFKSRGYRVVRNTPYAGGFTTRHYGQPRQGCHAVQIEISRALYMNETDHTRHQGFDRLAADLSGVVAGLAALTREKPFP
ncbi:MAG: N-formylglutamate amidohydrolase [Magnetospirillum sp. 64-120]|nr:MAG: N-formylglutamate amidohydrolase [Magnetospirillum sp. 64-120]